MAGWWREVAPWERRILFGALALGLLVRVVAVLAGPEVTLAGDEPYYHRAAILQTEGKWFWGTAPYGIPHESLQKAPIYQTWVGIWYSIFGPMPERVMLIQAFVSVSVVFLGWLLTRRLFGPRAAAAAAAVLAVYPNVFQFDIRLFSESLATPLTVLALILVLAVRPAPRVAVALGLVMGVSLLLRPSAILLFPALGIAWWAACGFRRAALLTAAVVALAAIVVAPWTIRNRSVEPDYFIPISTQDQASYGVFNDTSANDPDLPYKWRPRPERENDIVGPNAERRLSDGELHEELLSRVRAYIKENPESVPKAFYYNGITRLWDLRPPDQILGDTRIGKRSQFLSLVGLVMYWPLLLLALIALAMAWRAGRRGLVLTVLALALAASVGYTSDAGTRYRAPLEPLIVALACAAATRSLAAPRDASTAV